MATLIINAMSGELKRHHNNNPITANTMLNTSSLLYVLSEFLQPTITIINVANAAEKDSIAEAIDPCFNAAEPAITISNVHIAHDTMRGFVLRLATSKKYGTTAMTVNKELSNTSI